MKLNEVLAYADELRPNAFSNEMKTQWLNEIEGMVQTNVMLLRQEDVTRYSYAEHGETELLAKFPHDKIYWAYLIAMIDFADGDIRRYNNDMALFNERWSEYMRWYATVYRPADGQMTERGYYLSAYAIAVKHGFVGTEEEFASMLIAPVKLAEALQHVNDSVAAVNETMEKTVADASAAAKKTIDEEIGGAKLDVEQAVAEAEKQINEKVAAAAQVLDSEAEAAMQEVAGAAETEKEELRTYADGVKTGINQSAEEAQAAKDAVQNMTVSGEHRPAGEAVPAVEKQVNEKGEVNLHFLLSTGVYVGSGDMPEDCNVQIDPLGDVLTPEDLKGKDGSTPVRGVDYWTDADIAVIKGYVDEAILGGKW